MRSKEFYDNYEKHFWSNLVHVGGPDECWPAKNLCGRGYGGVTFKGKSHGAHVMAYRLSRKEDVPHGIQVCHTCDNPPCCNPNHLFLGTGKDNAQDCIKKGRKATFKGKKNAMYGKNGTLHPASKLTEKDVLAIRQLRRDGVKRKTIADMFGITPECVVAIAYGRTWKHVPVGEIVRYDHRTKLDKDDVGKIKDMLDKGISQDRIALTFGIHQAHVSKIKLGKVKAHNHARL